MTARPYRTHPMLTDNSSAPVCESTGAFIKQTTYPDTGTRLETYGTDGRLLGLTGSAVQPRSYVYGAVSGGAYTTEVKLDANGGTNEWATTGCERVKPLHWS